MNNEMIRIVATYSSGREEYYFVKKTKGKTNKKLNETLKKLRSFPTIINVRII